jgi:hypothetical protein
MRKLGKLFVGVFCALLIGTSAFAADLAVQASTNGTVAVTTAPATNTPLFGDWVFTLAGVGETTTSGNSQSTFGVNLSVGRELNLLGTSDEVGIRQSVSYASPNGGTTLASTRAYADVCVFCFNLTQNIPVDFYVGGNVGGIYGNTTFKWVAAPEVGVDVWLAKNVAIDGRIEYAFDLNSGRSENVLGYVLGVKFRL